MKAWLGDASVEPISPLCGICGVNDSNDQGMELTADDEDVIFEGKDVKRIGKEDEERHDEVKRLIDPRKPTKEEVDLHDLFHHLLYLF